MTQKPQKPISTVSKKRVLKINTLQKRLESIPNKLDLDEKKWGKLCRAILPEFFKGPLKHGMPATPLPGTPERIEVYARRVENQEEIFQPMDCVFTPTTL
jgi:hypothetical protein